MKLEYGTWFIDWMASDNPYEAYGIWEAELFKQRPDIKSLYEDGKISACDIVIALYDHSDFDGWLLGLRSTCHFLGIPFAILRRGLYRLGWCIKRKIAGKENTPH